MYKLEIEMPYVYAPHTFAFFRTYEDVINYIKLYNVMDLHFDKDGKFKLYTMCSGETHVITGGDNSITISAERVDDCGIDVVRIKHYSDFVPKQNFVYVLTHCPGYITWLFDSLEGKEMKLLEHGQCFNSYEEGCSYVDNAIKEYEKDFSSFMAKYPHAKLNSLEWEKRPRYPFSAEHFSWKEDCFCGGDWEGEHLALIRYSLNKLYVNNPTWF
jgi:hypothetical protein